MMRRHRFEPASLVMGLVLLGLTAQFLLDADRARDLSSPMRTVPMAVGGLALVVVTAIITQTARIARARRIRRRGPTPPPGA